MIEYQRTMRFSAGVEQTMEAVHTALATIRTEASQSIGFSAPVPGGPMSTSLAFRKVIPTAARQLAPFPLNWDPHDPSWVGTIQFSLLDGRLMRNSQLGATTVTGPVAEGISNFSSVFLPNGNLSIQISTRESERVRTVSTELFLTTMR